MLIFAPKNFGKMHLEIGTPKIDTPKIDTPKIDAFLKFRPLSKASIFGEELYIVMMF